jgi:multiple sugar transport system substrate-binding protein
MVRSGISMRLSGQGSGIAEKFRFVLEPAGGKLIEQTKSGKWHNAYDNDAGRNTLKLYVDMVQNWKVDDPKVPHDADAFANGQTGMLFREAWVIGEIQKKNPNLDYGVAPIPRWDAKSPYKMLVQPWAAYVSAKSKNKAACWEFLKFLTEPDNSRRITEMTGWGSNRQSVDWKPLLSKIPQFEVFVSPPKDVLTFSDPVIPVFDELESRMADKLPGLYVDASLKDNPAKIAETIHQLAMQTDSILKQGGMYGTE